MVKNEISMVIAGSQYFFGCFLIRQKYAYNNNDNNENNNNNNNNDNNNNNNNNTSIIIKALIKCWLLWNRQVLKYVDFLLTWGHIVIIPGTTDVDAR